MMVSFSVRNFLSIKERVNLSMLAVEHDKSFPDNILTVQLKRTRARPVNLLKSAVIYGPNASGKSNILKASQSFSHFVSNCVQNPGRPIPFAPFALDPPWRQRPSSFETSLIDNGVLYRYGFSADTSFIHREYLYAMDKAGERKIFERRNESKNVVPRYDYGPSGKNLRKVEQFVRPDSLILAVGASYNNEECRILWNRIGMMSPTGLDSNTRGTCLSARSRGKAEILSEIAKYLGFEFSKIFVRASSDHGLTDIIHYGVSAQSEVAFAYTDSQDREVMLDEKTQSAGTITFLNLLADILAARESEGGLIFLDEVETSLHPQLCEALFRFVHALPSKNVQFVCATHNTQLLDTDLFRRDQVWLTEKNREGATDFYSLADFKGKPRKDARLGKQYLEGRFGGLPVINVARVEEILSRFSA
jgi:AAA15 family ATPase/GTPase